MLEADGGNRDDVSDLSYVTERRPPSYPNSAAVIVEDAASDCPWAVVAAADVVEDAVCVGSSCLVGAFHPSSGLTAVAVVGAGFVDPCRIVDIVIPGSLLHP